MWEIFEHRKAAKQLDSLPPDILKRYEKWKDVERVSGTRGLRAIRGFNDEPLHGDWKGHRSSRLNRQFRVIYRVDRDQVFVEGVDVTAARALRCHPSVLVFPGWDLQHESAA